MTVLMDDVLSSIRGAFDIFAFGEAHMDEFLERYPFDREGIEQQWKMFDSLSENVMDFLRVRWASLGERNHEICRDYQMRQLWEKIERNESKYECYRSIMARSAA
jgi:hypothetical protein